MSKAWRRQAIPLQFTEVCLEAIRQDNQDAPNLERVCARAEKWLTQCWQPLQRTNVQLRQWHKRINQIHDIVRRHFVQCGVDIVELGNAMLYLVESAGEQVPEDRAHPWRWLAVAVDDFSLLVDPGRDDDEAIDRGLALGREIQSVIE